jgi:hypothetical protein
LVSGDLVWSKEVMMSYQEKGFVVYEDYVFAIMNSKLVKIYIPTGTQVNVTEDSVDSIDDADENSIYCTMVEKTGEMGSYVFDFHCFSFDPRQGKLNWNTKIDMNHGSIIPGKSILTIFTTNTVDKKFAVLDKSSGNVLRYEPISGRKLINNADDPAHIIFFHDNALRINKDGGTEKLIDYDKLPDWADVEGVYYDDDLFIFRKKGEIQKLDLKTGEPDFVFEYNKPETFKFDSDFGHFIGIGHKAFRLVSTENGQTVANFPLDKPITLYTLTKDEFILRADDKRLVIINKEDLKLKQSIETDKIIVNLAGSKAGLFGLVFDDGQYSIYSKEKH